VELWAAVVAAVAALIVAIVGLMTALVSQKQSARAAKELELLRRRQQQQDEGLKAIHAGISAIQEVKDSLQVVIEGFPDALDLPRCIDLVEKTRGRLASCYEAHMTLLSDEDRKAFHDAKGVAVRVEMHLARVARSAVQSELPTDTANFLRECRQQLGERQQLLRDSLLRKASTLM